MLQVDVITAYVICGAGSLIGAAMMALAQPDDPRARAGLRTCSWAFVVLGSGLVQLMFGGPVPTPAAMLWTAEGTMLGTALFGWGFAEFSGNRIRRGVMLASLLACSLPVALAQQAGDRVYGLVFCAFGTLISLVTVASQQKFIVRPRNLAERAIGLCYLAYAVSWLVRCAYILSYDGPSLVHLLYLPSDLISVFAVFYGVLPIIIAMLLLNLVNARLSQQLQSRALADELTGVMTRRALRELAPAMIDSAQRAGHQVAALMLDLDHFKAVNDRHGHVAGDAVLRHAAQLLQAALRPDSLLTRYGGEEFAIVLPVSDMRVARILAERLRSAIALEPCTVSGMPIPITASIGVSMLAPGEALDAALLRADEALYRAKREGRDRVETSIAVAA